MGIGLVSNEWTLKVFGRYDRGWDQVRTGRGLGPGQDWGWVQVFWIAGLELLVV